MRVYIDDKGKRFVDLVNGDRVPEEQVNPATGVLYADEKKEPEQEPDQNPSEE